MKHSTLLYFYVLILIFNSALSQVILMGENPPLENKNDGDFSKVWGSWRQVKQSPNWETKVIEGPNDKNMGLHFGKLYSMCDIGMAKTNTLITKSEFQKINVGDTLFWEFDADLEYISNGTLTFSLFFGNEERILAKKVTLIGSDKKLEHFSGKYSITKKDKRAGLPYLKVTFYSSNGVKVYLDNVNLRMMSPKTIQLNTTSNRNNIVLSWIDKNKLGDYEIYRALVNNRSLNYLKLGKVTTTTFLDSTFIAGKTYKYIITAKSDSIKSNTLTRIHKDDIAPTPPKGLVTKSLDCEIELKWNKNPQNDIAYYSIYRSNTKGEKFQQIAYLVKKNRFIDFTPKKEEDNIYYVVAHDFSGNKSEPSKIVTGKVTTIKGTSFNDLILPIPIHKKLTSTTWGEKTVIPRDIDNGMESPDWSYWGGRPVKDHDGNYHMCITRWPANATKGHWEWPNSTVAHVTSTNPLGPYKVVKPKAYEHANGYGHNPDIILLNDGTFLLYSLINWKPVLFHSKSMNGPWKNLGVLQIDTSNVKNEKPERFYRFKRNLSGVQLKDGRFLFVTKAGAMMVSKDNTPLGPYNVVSDEIKYNPIVPKKYRNSNYEDPVLWKDEVQFHMIINAYLDYRAIYLRSPDGIHWKFNSGTAYTPNDTSYEDGTKTHWHKLERPHVLTDRYGRATHLSLAAIDVPKEDDLARDNHNSKNIILPLVKHRRLRILNKEKIQNDTSKIRIEVISEEGFDAQKDIDLKSLRYGATEEVDTGRGCKLINTQQKGSNLILEFNGKGNGITANNFAGKLIGKTIKGHLIIGYSKLVSK